MEMRSRSVDTCPADMYPPQSVCGQNSQTSLYRNGETYPNPENMKMRSRSSDACLTDMYPP